MVQFEVEPWVMTADAVDVHSLLAPESPISASNPERGASQVTSEAWGAANELREVLTATPLPLPLPESGPVRELRTRLLDQLEDYVLPRLADPGRPMLVVVGGPTGVGKSTLVNTIVGETVTASGLTRPTTRSPVLVHHPADRGWFGAGGVLPSLARVDHPTDDADELQLVSTAAVPQGVALIDAPDFDSIDEDNRRLATRLLAAADMWLFVTSAARYADEAPWRELELAKQRSTPLLIVMNRIPSEDLSTVSTDFVRQLDMRGIGRGEVAFVEHAPVEDGLLQQSRVAMIKDKLDEMSTSRAAGRETTRRGVAGALRSAAEGAGRIAEEAHRQAGAIGDLLTITNHSYDTATATVTSFATDGTLLRGDLLGAWRDFIGTDEVLPMPGMMRLARERMIGLAADQQDTRIGRLELAIDLALEALVVEHAEQAASLASKALRSTSYGDAMLAWSDEDLTRPARRFGADTQKAITRWRRDLAGVAIDISEDDRAATRGLVIGLAVCALGEPGADLRTRATPGLVATARENLGEVIAGLMAGERDRYLWPATGGKHAGTAPGRLRAARRRVDYVVGRMARDV